MATSEIHREMMQRALVLARRGAGWTSPNPMVGAVLVKDGRVIGEGYHVRAGADHAEVAALRACRESPAGATLFVTLEPCCHHGKTPPCTDAILEAGIAEVYYAVGDPNPRVAGGGRRRLEAADVRVHAGLLEREAALLNRAFFHFIRTGRPYVTVKCAMSLDGKIATAKGESQWISCETSRREAHRLRAVTDAIMVGTETAIADNPRLTARYGPGPVRHPLRIVLDRHGRIPLSHHLFDPSLPGKTLVAISRLTPSSRLTDLAKRNIEALICEEDGEGRLDLEHLFRQLGARSLLALMVEGGAALLGSLLAKGLVDEVCAFVAPKIIGGREAPSAFGGQGFARLAEAYTLEWLETRPMGADLMLRARRREHEAAKEAES